MKTTTMTALVCVLGAVGCEPDTSGIFCDKRGILCEETDEPGTTTTGDTPSTTSESATTGETVTTSTTTGNACEPAPAFEAPVMDLCFEVDSECCPGVDADYVASVCGDTFDGALPVPYTCTMQPLPGEATDFRECAALKDVTVPCSWGTAVIACCALP